MAVHCRRAGAPLLLILLSAAVRLIRWRPIVGLLGVLAVLADPWTSLWPISAMREDLAAFGHGAAADPANPSFLLFVWATLVALGRVIFVRRHLLRRHLP